MTQTYTSPRYISVADTAKLVRTALKENFPGIKFSVRSSSYAGGSSISIHYTDGPTEDTVNAVVRKFEGASFDGSQDLKSYHDGELNGETVHFGADYVTPTRSLSVGFLTKVAAWYCKRNGFAMPVIKENSNGTGYIDLDTYIPQRNAYLSTLIYREYRKIDAQYADDLEAIQAIADWMDFLAYRVFSPIVEEEEDMARMESLECEIIPMYEGMVARNEEDAEHGLHVCRHELAQLQKKYNISPFADLIAASNAIQAQYSKEEWERMAHTPALTVTAEQVIEASEPEAVPACTIYDEGNLRYSVYNHVTAQTVVTNICWTDAKFVKESLENDDSPALQMILKPTLVTIIEQLPENERRVRVLRPDGSSFRALIGGELALHLKRYNAKLVTPETFEQELERRQ